MARAVALAYARAWPGLDEFMFKEASWDDEPTDVMASSEADGGLEALLLQAEGAVPTSSTVRAALKSQITLSMAPACAATKHAEESVELGFVSACAPGWAVPERFPSKVGGAPIWLHPIQPEASELCCRMCRKPLRFLLQLYCPRPELPHAYHRSLMIFCCGGECLHTEAGWRVLRCNLGKDTPFYKEMPDGSFAALSRPEAEGSGKDTSSGSAACNAVQAHPSAPLPLPELQLSIGMEGDWRSWVADGASEYAAREYANALEVLRRFEEDELASIGDDVIAEMGSSRGAVSGTSTASANPAAVTEVGANRNGDCSANLWCEDGATSRPISARALPLPRAGASTTVADEDGDEAHGEEEEDDEDPLVAFQRRISVWPEQVRLSRHSSHPCHLCALILCATFLWPKWCIAQPIPLESTPPSLPRPPCSTWQVLRYSHAADASPLWLSRLAMPGPVPPCSRCGAARWFEFQILPQLLIELEKSVAPGDACGGDSGKSKPNDAFLRELRDERALDWGTLAVYSCSQSCASLEGTPCAYTEEFCCHQQVA